MDRTRLCTVLLFLAVKGAAPYPTLHVDGDAYLGQPTYLRCTCSNGITLREPKGTAVLECKSTNDCQNNRPEHIFVDRDKSEGKTYVAVIKETRAGDEGKWRCQCGNQEATATLRIQPTTSLYLTGQQPRSADAGPDLKSTILFQQLTTHSKSSFCIYPSFLLVLFLLLFVCLV